MQGIFSSVQFMAQAQSASSKELLITFVPLVLIVFFFYFLLIRPQKKKDKEAKTMRDNIQIGDEIMTIGGIVGIVVRKNEDTVVIETGGDKSKLRIKNFAVQENLTLLEKANAAKAAKANEIMEARKNKKNKDSEE
jgi:preprotein translocase subunit YajC